MEYLESSQRCIVALDVANYGEAVALVEQLSGLARFYKIGLELFASGDGMRLLRELRASGAQVFVDLKLFDVPATVARATARVVEAGATCLTVHGNDAIMQAAADAARGSGCSILAVTVLTSLDEGDMRDLGFEANISDIARSRAARAVRLGCAGVVCSGWEVAALRAAHADITLVTPGVRQSNDATDTGSDQKRVATPRSVIAAGGDYIVVGRPIKNAPQPRAALQSMIDEIKAAEAAQA